MFRTIKQSNQTNLRFFFLQASDGGVREAVLTALKGVIKHAGKNVGSVIRSRVCILLKDTIQLEDDEVRESAAKVMGTISQV